VSINPLLHKDLTQTLNSSFGVYDLLPNASSPNQVCPMQVCQPCKFANYELISRMSSYSLCRCVLGGGFCEPSCASQKQINTNSQIDCTCVANVNPFESSAQFHISVGFCEYIFTWSVNPSFYTKNRLLYMPSILFKLCGQHVE